jgi:hypothetical protein
MTEPASDDGWDELARELGVEKSAPSRNSPPAADYAAPPTASDDEDPGYEVVPDDVPLEGEALSDDSEQDEGEEGEGEATGGEGQPEEGQPGTGRKRRRRRRRRKKGGAAAGATPEGTADAANGGDAPEAEAEDEPAGSYGAAVRPARAPRPAPAEVVEREPEEFAADEEESAAVTLAAEEDTGGEMLRDLIANWNVPSWGEIIGGLYRPER